VVARFYNNRASEYWVQGDKARAYAYFKAALQADPSFGPAYSNLAMLYTRHDLWQPAEVLLRHALALSDAMDAPLLALHRLLIRQGRPEEAKAMEVEIQSHQARNPYFWLAKGQSYLLKQEYRDAIQALECALELSNGFVEVHAHLALAYWYDGQRQQAEAQIKQLQVLPRSESILALLNRKLAATH
jgi:Tfp pilus assembly protein PilF